MASVACQAWTSIGILPAAWTASTWKATPREAQTWPISATGCATPVSLFAAMTETSAVSGRIAAATDSAETTPRASGATRVTVYPSRSSASAAWRTASCSIALTMMWRPLKGSALAPPMTPMLSDSVPPLVKTISPGVAFRSAATWARASSTAPFASWPNACTLEAFPKCSPK